MAGPASRVPRSIERRDDGSSFVYCSLVKLPRQRLDRRQCLCLWMGNWGAGVPRSATRRIHARYFVLDTFVSIMVCILEYTVTYTKAPLVNKTDLRNSWGMIRIQVSMRVRSYNQLRRQVKVVGVDADRLSNTAGACDTISGQIAKVCFVRF